MTLQYTSLHIVILYISAHPIHYSVGLKGKHELSVACIECLKML